MRTMALTALAAVLLAVSGCAAISEKGSGVVVTTNILGDITKEIAGDETEVTVLMKPGADPHSFGVAAKQAAKLEQSELIIHNGLGLEEGVRHHVEAAAEAGVPTLAVAEEADPIEYTDGETAGEADPHFWTDPVRVAEAVDVIAEQITETVSGVDVAAIKANAKKYRSKVSSLHKENIRAFDGIPSGNRKLVTNHHVFGYLAKRYDFEVIGAVVPSGTTLASPSSADLKDLAEAVKESGVTAVFADSTQPDKLAKAMARETGMDIDVIPLYSESLTDAEGGAGTYLRMAAANTAAIAEGLS
ncbi:MAG: zinc ABC transporter substrate-binding protein AztC [Stackebrandtia sp.]